MTTNPIQTLSLDKHLDPSNDEGKLPSTRNMFPISDRHLLVYGGDDGIVLLLTCDDISSLASAVTSTLCRCEDSVRTVSCVSGKLVIGTVDGSVEVYSYADGGGDQSTNMDWLTLQNNNNNNSEDLISQMEEDVDGIPNSARYTLTRKGAGIRHIVPLTNNNNNDVGKGEYTIDSRYIVVCSEEMDGFIIWDLLLEKEHKNHVQTAKLVSNYHRMTGVRSCAVQGDTLATLGMDGTLCTWKVVAGNEDDVSLEFTKSMRDVCDKDVGELNGTSIASMCMKPHIVLLNQNQHVFLPGEPVPRTMDGSAKYATKRSGNSYASILDTISTTANSNSDKNLIITSHSSGHIVAWDIKSKMEHQLLHTVETLPAAVCMWNEYVVCITDEANLSVHALSTGSEAVNSVTAATATDASAKAIVEDMELNGGGDDDDDDVISTVSAPKAKKLVASAKISDFVVTADDNSNNVFENTPADKSDKKQPRKNQFIDDEASDDDDDDDDGASFSGVIDDDVSNAKADNNKLTAMATTTVTAADDDITGEDIDDLSDASNPFQGEPTNAPDDIDFITGGAVASPALLDHLPMPGSTSEVSDTQILCWNYNGCITSRIIADDVVTQNIDIAFANNLVNKPVRFNNLAKDRYTVASLGESGSVYAGDDVIYYHSNNNLANWTHKLPDGENAIHLAVGLFGAAVFTDKGYLRLFSPSGLQFHLRIADVSTMVARGNYLLLIDSRRNYTFYNVTIENLEKLTSGVFYEKTNFAWIGITDTYSPCALMDDVMCVLYGGSAGDDYCWVPMLDVGAVVERKSYTKFWPVTVHGDQLIGVPLHHRDHPDPVRRPVTSALSLKMPLCKNSSGMEEIHLRASCAMSAKLGTTDDYEAEYTHLAEQLDKVTLKLLHSALESSDQHRALDICQRLRTGQGLEVAYTLCEQLGYVKLCRAVENLRDDMFPEEEEEDGEDDGTQSGLVDEHSTTVSLTPEGSVYEGLGRSPVKRSRVDDSDDGDNSTVATVQDVTDKVPRSKIRKGPTNPFAKKNLSSPVKKSSKPNLLLSPGLNKSTPKLSRLSTFSARSRENVKKNKHFI